MTGDGWLPPPSLPLFWGEGTERFLPDHDHPMLNQISSSSRFPGSIPVRKTGFPAAATQRVHPDPRGYLLIQVLMSGYALRCMNHIRVTVEGGLNAALILYDLLGAERESLFANGLFSLAKVPDVPPTRSRSIAAIAHSTELPRESVRRFMVRLAAAGWIEETSPARYRTTHRTRHWFALADDAGMLLEFIWIGSQIKAVLDAGEDALAPLLARHPWQVALATQREGLVNPPYLEAMPVLRDRLRVATPSETEYLAHRVDGLMYRHLKACRQTFEGDLMLPILIGEIGHRNMSQVARRDQVAPYLDCFHFHYQDPHSPESCLEYLPSNTYSISLTTGIPETTVRRKVALLVERGWINQEVGRSLSINASAILEHTAQLNADWFADMLGTYQVLCTLGYGN